MTSSITATPTSAIAFASIRVPIADVEDLVGEVRDRMVGDDRLESAAQIAVLHDGQLQGLVRIEDLLSSARDVPVVSVMDSDPPIIDPGSDQEAAAIKAVRQQESSLAVVGADGRFVGLIPPPVGGVMRRELLTGLSLGVVLGILAFPAIAWWVGPQVALTVAISIWAASTVAAGVAMALPWAFSKSNIDPAFGSGPLATVVQDLLSIAIYFAVATLVFI